MKVIRTVAELVAAIRTYKVEQPSASIGFVPTMGYLHQGHASLLERSRQDNDLSVLSIFVNPIQFGPNEDLDRYPRDEERDLATAERTGVDIAFLPAVEEMYPTPTKTKVAVSELTSLLCGASRPGHFDGVTTVVSKLFHMVKPTRAYFGMKDAQQVAVLTQMVADLNMDVEIVPCPIVREADGLALSSRNVYLSPEQRKQALTLSQSLLQAVGKLEEDVLAVEQVKAGIIERISQAPLADIEYVEVISFPSLERLSEDTLLPAQDADTLIALAVRFGSTRLIDNIRITKKKGESFPCSVK